MSTQQSRTFLALILVVITLLTACQPQAATPTASQPATQPSVAPALLATVKEVTGSASIKQPGDSAFSPATVGIQLQPNGEIQTGNDGRVRLDLSTGTIIRVAPSSLFTLTSNQSSNGSLSTQTNLSVGGLFVILNGGNASVNTPSGVASVKGSYLSVYIDPATQSVTVTCLEGHCGAGNSAGNTDFGTGQEVTLFSCTAGQCTVPGVGPMTPQDFKYWLDNNPDLQLPGLSATMTALAAPPATNPPADTATPDATCVVIITPNHHNGDESPAGPLTFSWKPKDGAAQYKLDIHYPNGVTASFFTDQTEITRYLESMPDGGSYSWNITAYDSNKNPICTTGDNSFSKTKYDTPVPNKPLCTINNAQYQYPNKPCYCNIYSNQVLPPYCQGG